MPLNQFLFSEQYKSSLPESNPPLADQASSLISPAFGDFCIASQAAKQMALRPADSQVPATEGVYGNARP